MQRILRIKQRRSISRTSLMKTLQRLDYRHTRDASLRAT